MKTINKKVKLAIAAIFGASLATAVYAFPQYDEELEYFSDNTYTQSVGWKHVTCQGTIIREGQQTNYYKVIRRTSCSIDL